MQITGLLHLLVLPLIFIISSSVTVANNNTKEPTLKILTWEEYFAPEIIALWQKQSGVMLEQIYYDNENNRDAIISNGQSYNLDLVILDSSTAHVLGAAKHLEALDKTSISGSTQHNKSWQQQCGQQAVPYLWGTLGIAYRIDKLPKPPNSWKDLLLPSASLKGHIGMLNNYVDTLAPSLLLRSESVSTDNQDLLKQSFYELVEQLPSVLTYEYAISFLKSNAKADQLYMALAYSGDEAALNEISGSSRWKYIIPNEGTLLWLDCIAVMANSTSKLLATQFIEFLNQPNIAALNSEWNHVATTNNGALPLLSQEFLADKNSFPDAEVRRKAQKDTSLSKENMLQRDRIVSALLIRYDAL